MVIAIYVLQITISSEHPYLPTYFHCSFQVVATLRLTITNQLLGSVIRTIITTHFPMMIDQKQEREKNMEF